MLKLKFKGKARQGKSQWHYKCKHSSIEELWNLAELMASYAPIPSTYTASTGCSGFLMDFSAKYFVIGPSGHARPERFKKL